MSENYKRGKLREIFDSTIESGLEYSGSLDKIDYYNLFCKAATKDKVYTLMGVNLCMYTCKFNEEDSVLMIFYIPINEEDSVSKTMGERVIEIIDETEECFITLPFVKMEKVDEEKFVYVSIIKEIKES